MLKNDNEFMWCEKYRPQNVADCILPNSIKKKAEQVIQSGEMQNMLFYSGPGTGKTTLAKAMCEQLDLDYILINGSREGRLIETARNTVSNFANTMSIYGSGIKVVIYDEFDNSGNDVQMAIRGIMDEVSSSCRFIFTGNYVTKIIEPLHSRVTMVDFSVPQKEIQTIMGKSLERCCAILDLEGVPYKKDAVAKYIMKTFPDFRKMLNELQAYSVLGEIDMGILEITNTRYETLVDHILLKDFKGCEKWMTSNNYDGSIYSLILKAMRKKIDGRKYAEVVLCGSDAQYRHAFAVDPDITLQAFCVSVMGVV